MATPQQIASQAGSANTAYQMQAARQSYGRKRKPTQVAQQENQALNGLQTTRRQRLDNLAVERQPLVGAGRTKKTQRQPLIGAGRTKKTQRQPLIGRARRKKGGNYTSYGQTGGALAPSGNGSNPKVKHPRHGGGGLVYTPGGTFREPRDPKPYVTTGDSFGRGNSHGVAIVRGDGVFAGPPKRHKGPDGVVELIGGRHGRPRGKKGGSNSGGTFIKGKGRVKMPNYTKGNGIVY